MVVMVGFGSSVWWCCVVTCGSGVWLILVVLVCEDGCVMWWCVVVVCDSG